MEGRSERERRKGRKKDRMIRKEGRNQEERKIRGRGQREGRERERKNRVKERK